MTIRKLLFAALLALVVGVTAGAAGPSRIELDDGTTVVGEIRSMDGARYVVITETLGRITIDADRVLRISRGGSLPTADTTAGSGSAVAAYGEQIMAAPSLMALVTALQSDPELQAAIADPEFMRLIASGDLAALRSDGRMRKLMENPRIREILEQVQR